MSKRRQLGDIVKKKANAGFVGEELIIRLVHFDLAYPPTDYCMLDCGDPECREWPNTQVVVDGRDTEDYCYHVSECEMEDI